jgi:hypothetical protein
MDEASSAIDAAIVRTKRQGISQPKTMPTCPPDTSGNPKVDETEETTPMIEKEKAISSVIWEYCQRHASQRTNASYRKFPLELWLVTELSEPCIVGISQGIAPVTVYSDKGVSVSLVELERHFDEGKRAVHNRS